MARKNGSSPNYVQFGPEEIIVIPQEDRGKLSENDYGPYFLRHWQDSKFSCLSEGCERRLIDCGVRAGVPVGITKMQYGKSAIWKVRVIDNAKPQPIRTNGHAKGHGSNAWDDLPHSPIPEAKFSAPAANGTPHTLEEQLKASIDHVQAAKAAMPVQPVPVSDMLTRCAIAAINAARSAEAYASSQGYHVKFREEQIAGWTSTLFINSAKLPKD